MTTERINSWLFVNELRDMVIECYVKNTDLSWAKLRTVRRVANLTGWPLAQCVDFVSWSLPINAK